MTIAKRGLVAGTILGPAIWLSAFSAPDMSQAGREDLQALVAAAPFEQVIPTLREGAFVVPLWIEFLTLAGFESEARRLVKIADPTGAEDVDLGIAVGLVLAGKVDEGLALVRSGKPAPVREHALALLQAVAGRVGEALATVRGMKGDTEEVRAQLAKGLARTDQPDAALTIARSLPTSAESTEVLGLIGEAFVRAGRHQEAVALGNALAPNPSSPSLGIADALATAGRLNDALAIVKQVEPQPSRTTHVAQLVDRLVAAGHLDSALAAARGIKSPGPAAYSLAGVAAGLARANQPGLSKLAATEAQWRLDAARKTEDPPEAERIMSVMAGRFASGGLTDPAFALIRNISDPERRTSAIQTVVHGLVEHGRTEMALTVLDTEGARLSAVQRAYAYESIVTALARSGKAAQALDDPRYSSLSDRSALAHGLAAGGAVEAAIIAAGRIPDEEHRRQVLCGLAPKLAESRAYREARLAAERCVGLGRFHTPMLIVRAFALNEFPDARTRRAVLDKYREH
jgi:hypothetical protein